MPCDPTSSIHYTIVDLVLGLVTAAMYLIGGAFINKYMLERADVLSDEHVAVTSPTKRGSSRRNSRSSFGVTTDENFSSQAAPSTPSRFDFSRYTFDRPFVNSQPCTAISDSDETNVSLATQPAMGSSADSTMQVATGAGEGALPTTETSERCVTPPLPQSPSSLHRAPESILVFPKSTSPTSRHSIGQRYKMFTNLPGGAAPGSPTSSGSGSGSRPTTPRALNTETPRSERSVGELLSFASDSIFLYYLLLLIFSACNSIFLTLEVMDPFQCNMEATLFDRGLLTRGWLGFMLLVLYTNIFLLLHTMVKMTDRFFSRSIGYIKHRRLAFIVVALAFFVALGVIFFYGHKNLAIEVDCLFSGFLGLVAGYFAWYIPAHSDTLHTEQTKRKVRFTCAYLCVAMIFRAAFFWPGVQHITYKNPALLDVTATSLMNFTVVFGAVVVLRTQKESAHSESNHVVQAEALPSLGNGPGYGSTAAIASPPRAAKPLGEQLLAAHGYEYSKSIQ